MSAPSAYQLEQAMAVLLSARERLLTEEPDLADDDKLFQDMLDGETDALDVLRRVIRASIEAKALAQAAQARIDEIRERKERFMRRSDALRGMAFAAMDALGLRKMEEGDFTASLRPGQPAVVITDETRLPEAFVRVKREPDKALISAALKAGQNVDGAELSNGMPTITVRTR